MRRVVVTGMGIWSCIGQDLQTVTESLRQGRSGVIFDPKRIEYGLQSGLVGNVPRPNLKPLLPRKFRATMSEDAEYAFMAVRQAIQNAELLDEYMLNNEVGLIFGAECNTERINGAKQMEIVHDSQLLEGNSLFKIHSSSATMNLSTIFHIKGINLCVAAACASSSHAIGLAQMFIREGLQDIVIVGGISEVTPLAAAGYEAIEGISLQNGSPQKACRPFDKERDGGIQSGGGAALILEEYDHAKKRGSNIIAELVGWGASSDGMENLTTTCGEGISRAIKRALLSANLSRNDIDYVCATALSDINKDRQEAIALSEIFGHTKTYISSTESMTGHENIMAGASKSIHTLLMMQNNFVAPNINLENVIDEAKDLNIARKTVFTTINTAIVNSSGMGGTNSALIFRKI